MTAIPPPGAPPTSDRKPSIRPGSRVRLHLAIHLGDGTEALSTFGESPLELTLGDGTLTPGTEQLLLGLTAGGEAEHIADGNLLFGPWREDNLHWLAKTEFPDTLPQPGSLVAFATPDRADTPGIVKEIQGDQVRVDFNHPLSGRVLRLRYQVLAVADPAALP